MERTRETNCRAWITAAVLLLSGGAASAQIVTFESETLGQPPKDFEFGLAGEGGPGRWELVADPTAGGGKALAQLSSNTAEFRFLVAMYKPVTATFSDPFGTIVGTDVSGRK